MKFQEFLLKKYHGIKLDIKTINKKLLEDEKKNI